MSTALDEDLIVLEDLDFDVDPECDGPTCSNTATWMATLLCCGKQFFLCDMHHKLELVIMRRIPNRQCFDCQYSWNADNEFNMMWSQL